VQSSSQIITTNKPINIQFFTGWMPFLSPNQQHQSTKGKNITFRGLAYPQAHLGVFQLCLWSLIAPGYLGGGLPCLSSALWFQYPKKNRVIVLYKVMQLHNLQFYTTLAAQIFINQCRSTNHLLS